MWLTKCSCQSYLVQFQTKGFQGKVFLRHLDKVLNESLAQDPKSQALALLLARSAGG